MHAGTLVGHTNMCVLSLAAASSLADISNKSQAEVERLKEWLDVMKRMADDKAGEAAEQLEHCRVKAAEQHAATAGVKNTCMLEQD